MCAAGGAAAGGGAAAAAIAQAVRASGMVVQLETDDFQRVLDHMKEPLVVMSEGGFFSRHYRYLTSYKGIGSHTKTDQPIHLPRHAEIISAKRMWFP